jgi:mRNA-degrading endonuclease toxin of MazEF toxin-antitoxin module
MTNLRFQVVSITAVFTAVGIGLALGTVARDGPASTATSEELRAVVAQNDDLQHQVDYLNRGAVTLDKFAEELVPAVLAGRLKAAKVLVLATPSGVDSIAGVRRMLSVAGAELTGAVQVTSKFTDPRYEDELLDLAHTVLPSDVVTDLPNGVDGVTASSALLSSVLLKRTPALAEQNLRTVLASYTSQGYLGGTDGVKAPADVVVVVSGPPATDADAARRNAAVLAMVTQFDRAGRAVVAATTDTGAGNLVAQVRLDPQLRMSVSTVDNVATPQGRLVTAWAAADQIAGKTGHYGSAQGTALVPKISP